MPDLLTTYYPSPPSGWNNFRALVIKAWKEFAPPPMLTVREWAQQKRYITLSTGGDSVKYRASTAPYQLGPLDSFQNPEVETITLMWAIQTGKTKGVIENIIGYCIDQNPTSILNVLPTYDKAKTYSKLYLNPLIEETPSLREKCWEEKMNRDNSAMLMRFFPGGVLIIGGANSPVSLSMLTMPIIILDEIDEYPISAGAHGDPVTLAKGRATNIVRRKFIETSKPTIAGLSRIETSYNQSNRMHYYVPCPHCRYMQVLLFTRKSTYAHLSKGYLTWNGDLTHVAYVCGNCNQQIPERYKHSMLKAGEWRAEHPHITQHHGFQLSGLYSPLGFTWVDLVKEFIAAKAMQDIDALRVFINQRLGETFSPAGRIRITLEQFNQRLETWENIPDEIILITSYADVQGDRLELLTIGWARNEETWLLDRKVIPGNPDNITDVCWKELWQYYSTTKFTHACGLQSGINLLGVDSGDCTDKVYAFCKRYRKHRVFATKGRGGWERDIIGANRKSGANYTRNSAGANFFIIGTDKAKLTVMNRFAIKETGPGYMHFHSLLCDDEYFEQLTAEEIQVVKKRGNPVRVWVRIRKRNEILDMTVGNLALRLLLKPDMEYLHTKREQYIAAHTINAQPEPAPDQPAAQTPEQPAQVQTVQPQPRKKFKINKITKSRFSRF